MAMSQNEFDRLMMEQQKQAMINQYNQLSGLGSALSQNQNMLGNSAAAAKQQAVKHTEPDLRLLLEDDL